jgi:aminomethyltransferase
MIKKTALYNVHVQLGAKMMPFAGYEMPIRYSGDKDEHFVVRNQVGLFDVSHMGEFIFKGNDALDFLQSITSNDVSKLRVGKAQYSTLPNLNGGLVDDIIVYHLDNAYMMVVNAANIQKDWNWIQERKSQSNFSDLEIIDISEQTSLIAVSGPLSTDLVSKLTNAEVQNMKYYEVIRCQLLDFENVLVATTGYTGEWTYEIFCANHQVVPIWNALMEKGKDLGVKPAGLGARDTLRLEMGYMLYGNDINDETSPIEAGLTWITKLQKGKFSSSEIFQNQVLHGVTKKLVAFEMQEKAIPRHDYEILDASGQSIGKVTSGTMSPCLEKGIGMGYVKPEFANLGTEIYISIRNKPAKAMVVQAPFVKNTSVQRKK